MTEEKELKIPFKDLTRIAVECECGTEITLGITDDWTKQIQKQEDWNLKCPTCPRKLPESLCQAIFRYLTWYELAIKSKQTVFFRLKKNVVEP